MGGHWSWVLPGMSGVSGAALWESSCINRSLSALSDVLGALAEHRPHVPYRNSKLTHLLQDALGESHRLFFLSPATQDFHGCILWERLIQLHNNVIQCWKKPKGEKKNVSSTFLYLSFHPPGGDAKLLVMLCVSPTQRFVTESLQSLGFGTRARQVQKEPPRRKNNSLKVKWESKGRPAASILYESL